MEIEIKKKLVADLLEDPECRKEALNILIDNKNSRDSEIRNKYKIYKASLGGIAAKRKLAEEYFTGLKNIDRILYPPKKFNYLTQKHQKPTNNRLT